jgi:hypothetical protein
MTLYGLIIEIGEPDEQGWRWVIRCPRQGWVMNAPDPDCAQRWARHLSEHQQWRT